MFRSNTINTQNSLLLKNLMTFYKKPEHLSKMIGVINGDTNISLRIVDWFVTNFSKKYYTVYDLNSENTQTQRFKVYNDYKLKLKAYSKKRFDPFCRWDRISIPYNENQTIETTIGQMNFFKWAIENKIVEYITENYDDIENDMNKRNSTSKNRSSSEITEPALLSKTRKKREELSISACKCIKKETVKIVVKFNE